MDSGELPLCISAELAWPASVDIAHVSSTSATKRGWLYDHLLIKGGVYGIYYAKVEVFNFTY